MTVKPNYAQIPGDCHLSEIAGCTLRSNAPDTNPSLILET
jgi:hypothetical protein